MKIDENNQFEPSPQNVAQILQQYNLQLKDYSAASTGLENTTLIVNTDDGKFAVRVYRQQKKDSTEIDRELDFMDYLRSHGIKIPRIIPNTQGGRLTLARFSGKIWQIILMEFIEGYHAKTYTPKLLVELSHTQATMHNLSSVYTDHHKNPKQLTKLKEGYFIHQIPQETMANPLFQPFLQRAAAFELPLPEDLPKGLCHLDYDTDNTLVANNTLVSILDFDDLAMAPFVVCLAYTLWHVHKYTGAAAAKSYLQSYETLRKLSNLERQYIKPIMLFRHYVISSVAILNGRTSPKDISAFLKQESQLN